MIPVRPAAEPPAFDADVRQPGLRAIVELAGETPVRAAGRRYKQVAESREEIPAGAFPPYWRAALGDLTRHAPFVARELRRQGRLRNEDC